MAIFVLLLLILVMADSSGATWCVCRRDQSSTAQQRALDYACGNGADCTQILQNGACYNPNTVADHCSYAVNSYFQRRGQGSGTCDFAGTATPVQTDPSPAGTSCVYPSNSSSTIPITPSPPGTISPPGIISPPGTVTPPPPGFFTASPPGFITPPGFDNSSALGFLSNPDLGSLLLILFCSSCLVLLRY